jgi:His-Xaa-Ser repeat protein HxsA
MILKTMIMRVQLALMTRGYDPGAVDGVLTEETKAALRSFQKSRGFAESGRLTTETLTALGIQLAQ